MPASTGGEQRPPVDDGVGAGWTVPLPAGVSDPTPKVPSLCDHELE